MWKSEKPDADEQPEAKPVTKLVSKNLAAHTGDEEVAVAAYFKAEKRGFKPGNELEDWYEAEADAELEKSK
ncbi:MAG: DUF2934 domain-containing protein [Gammaproteobacteria bacterium]|nr:DUF2934 domain-containing protein [Gammaproteobacteria bacterium]